MIKSKQDYRLYLQEDQMAMGANTKYPVFHDNMMILLTDPCWKFQKAMRRLEYWTNCKKGFLSRLYIYCLRKSYQRMSMRLGFSIPINVFGKGLAIVHYGSIVISRHARIGDYCIVNSAVNIGGTAEGAAEIGHHCYIGPRAKIYGPIRLGNHVKIGANAVVNKSFECDDILLVGLPARAVPQKNTFLSKKKQAIMDKYSWN